ncbi:MAG: hypothetical protein OXC54_00380 [Rhodospirillaceae bacterium]|nr:hypothetical protein [Rhodospirillaceae bacterium]
MERHRTIAASPVRSAAEAWEVVTTLIADTLERSPAVPAGSVRVELAALNGLGPVLIAGGHLESKGLVLCDAGLHVTVTVATADAALRVKENLNPVPGGARATDGWTLYIPLPGALNASVEAAAKRSSYLSTDPPPKSAPASEAKKGEAGLAIDLDALRAETSKW